MRSIGSKHALRATKKIEQLTLCIKNEALLPGKATVRQEISRGPPATKRSPKGNTPSWNSTQDYSILSLMWLYSFSATRSEYLTTDVSEVYFKLTFFKTFESAVLTKLVAWASSSFEKSLGQPTLPHIIIALNATDLAIDASQWDVEEATRKLLSDIEASVEKIPALQNYVSSWRLNGRKTKQPKIF